MGRSPSIGPGTSIGLGIGTGIGIGISRGPIIGPGTSISLGISTGTSIVQIVCHTRTLKILSQCTKYIDPTEQKIKNN